MGAMIRRLPILFWLAIVLACVTLQGEPRRTPEAQVPEEFPVSAWLEKKEITQIRWTVSVWKLDPRADLRQELSISARVLPQELQKTGDTHDLVMFARALEGGRVVGPVYSVTPYQPTDTQRKGREPPVFLPMIAIVKPGKYRLELALLDRATGLYSTKFENVSVEGPKHDPLEQSFRQFSNFEFVPRREPEERDRPVYLPPEISAGNLGLGIGIMIRGPSRNYSRLTVWSAGSSAELPSFVVRKPGVHLSILALLTPPDDVIGESALAGYFQDSLVNILTILTRLRAPEGTVQLTGIDLMERKRVFDREDVQHVTPEVLSAAIRKDTSTTSLGALAGMASNGRFFTDLLKESFDRAEQDAPGTEHHIILVGTRTAFTENSIEPLPAGRCRCSVHYIRFFLDQGRDDIEKLLRNYKPQIYEPRSWPEFREQFGRLYEQLQQQN
jgi:hypothetical protein